jgi:hypothetical protein
MEKTNFVADEALFEIETLQDWRLEAGANQEEIPPVGSCSNTSSNCNTADTV